MAIFGKSKKASADASVPSEEMNAKQTAKGKKEKKAKIIMRNLRFEDSVMKMVYDSMSNESGAVRRVDGGYLAIVLDDSVLRELGMGNEAVGSFGKAVKDRAISACVLPNEIANGHLVLIPDATSLERLREFKFMRTGEFNWCFMRDGLTEDDTVEILDQKTTLDELQSIADNETSLTYQDGKVLIGSSAPAGASDGFDDDAPYVDDTGFVDEELGAGAEMSSSEAVEEIQNMTDAVVAESNIVDEVDNVADGSIDDIAMVDFEGNNYGEAVEEQPLDEINLDDFDDSDLDFDADFEEFSDTDLALFDEEANAANLPAAEPFTQDDLDAALTHSFVTGPFDLPVDMDTFDMHFRYPQLPEFKFDPSLFSDVPELMNHVQLMADSANAYIKTLHDQNQQKLKDDYMQALRAEVDALTRHFDISPDANTEAAARANDIRDRYTELIDNKPQEIEKKIQELRDQYNEKKQRYVDQAIAAAERSFDNANETSLHVEIEHVGSAFEEGAKSVRDQALADLYVARKEAAHVLYDRAQVRILQNLSDEFRMNQEQELEEYERTRQEIESYLKGHYSDDIMRAKALRDELDRHNEVDVIRKRYDELQIANKKEIERMRNEASNALDDLRAKSDESKKQLVTSYEDKIAEYERKVAEKDERIQQGYGEIKDLQAEFARADERKQIEFEHRLAQARDEVDAKNRQMDAMQEDQKRKGTMFIVACVSVGLLCLLLGTILGFTVIPGMFGGASTVFQSVSDMIPSGMTDVVKTAIGHCPTALL